MTTARSRIKCQHCGRNWFSFLPLDDVQFNPCRHCGKRNKNPKKPKTEKRYIQLKKTVGIEIEWHIEDGNVVIDKTNIPINEEVIKTICPEFVREFLSEKDRC